MTKQIEFSDNKIQIDVTIIARAFGLTPSMVQTLMREEQITSRAEQGIDEDAGRHRVTFWYGDQALRLTFDTDGTLLAQSRFPAMRKPQP